MPLTIKLKCERHASTAGNPATEPSAAATTGEVLSTLTHAEDGESLFDLDVDGGWLSAAVRGPDNDQYGVYLADLATDAVHIIDTDARLALNHLCC